ncbi:bifunctional UDP-N-acetylglucosamine diphosphorylase/glucosamine-1-phosphate N-acetyltransferase GlmU [Acidovorax sp. sic0104]|uniref:bifunctional UDP-N-acetylglucosamine diphosphorylase/glucosamine-1-phosphate N-acetyltransferase GlmU n=1 Tax=Acidovorax sp. sic0104 TaxID=2854784 RepID=UPI001C48DAE4|nr:bifunctional UDP-N-acetylglucosamine diphosphorylase/glucosamine-1-phosphate N-acetyltransferase GlmU [Acidovorax sp. sic0104]MBV7541138.1 bifunctional UDP-N-acetylglucosamine diphosphorylase/glucosamine-1-phosphate N-acetyltransferase GlmU [Acidovorax sp. sic0104]
MTQLDILIMAAGKGTRMKSRIPKVLQRLAGRPLLHHVLDQAAHLQARSAVVITGHGATDVEAACAGAASGSGSFDLKFARQEPQLGTGHAVLQAVPLLADDGVAVVLSGDVPLTQADTLRALVQACTEGGNGRLALLTVTLPDPTGYGRIVRNAAGDVQGIVEHKDASDEERAITEIYSGIMAVPTQRLKGWLARLTNDNAQGEYYLTDIVAMAVADGVPVVAHRIADALQVAGVNSPLQLAELERAHQLRVARGLMEQGVRLADPSRLDVRDDARTGVRGELVCGQDVEIDVNCVFTGRVELGEGVAIGAHCCIANATIAAGAVIHPYTHIDGEKAGASVGAGALIGPFARLRPGAQLGREVHIGNFVEVKNSTLADGAKANHLAYLGDATVGERVNYGAGSITANYDGANKHRTVIEADVHVGSNCVLVAPVTIGAGGTVGGGSTITKSTAPGALSVARGKQVSIANWQRPRKGGTP